MDFFKKQASSFLSSQDEPPKKESHGEAAPKKESYGEAAPKKESHGETSPKKESHGKSDVPSYSELMGSANVLLGAAKGQFGGDKEGGKSAALDKAKLADAAEDVLEAASHYGKFEGTQYEGYVKKAEDYLQTYRSRDGADLLQPADELKKSAEGVAAPAATPAAAATKDSPAAPPEPSVAEAEEPPTKSSEEPFRPVAKISED